MSGLVQIAEVAAPVLSSVCGGVLGASRVLSAAHCAVRNKQHSHFPSKTEAIVTIGFGLTGGHLVVGLYAFESWKDPVTRPLEISRFLKSMRDLEDKVIEADSHARTPMW